MRRLLPLTLILLLAVPTMASASAGKRAKNRCPAGTTPVVKQRGKQAVPKRDRRGRVRCRKIKVGKPPAPAATPLGQAAAVTDALRDAGAANPRAMARLQRAVGKRRAQRLLAVTLDGWQRTAGAARAAQAGPEQTSTFTPAAGVTGSVSFGVQPATGADSGFTATATASVDGTREGIAKLAPGAADKLPPDVTRAHGEVAVTFEDKVTACASQQGRKGRVKANGKVKLTVERAGKPPVELELEADVDVSYTGRQDGIDDVDVKTTLRSAATGEPTRTYRGHRLGTGFGRAGILGSSDVAGAIAADIGHFDSGAGGVFGPKGSWSFGRGISVSDLRSIDNVKAMYTTAVATDLLTLAALEYARKVALPRAEKEPCGYTVAMHVDGRGAFATHDASGQFAVTATTTQSGPGTWHAAVPAAWSGLTFTSKTECPYVDPVSGGTFTVDLALTEAGRLKVDWSADAGAGMATASVDCPPEGDPPVDPPPIPGQPGPSLAGIAPMSVELPPEGGSVPLAGGVTLGADGFFNDGVLTVVRTR